MNKEEVQKLAGLARIHIVDSEAESLTREFESIINYVSEVKNASKSEPLAAQYAVKNVFRADEDPHEGGVYTKEILNNAPDREGDYIKVKKIL